jgi:hypothetical protein
LPHPTAFDVAPGSFSSRNNNAFSRRSANRFFSTSRNRPKRRNRARSRANLAGAVDAAHQADHSIAILDLHPQHLDHRAVVGREVVLDDSVGVDRAQGIGHGLAVRAEVAAGGAEKTRGIEAMRRLSGS